VFDAVYLSSVALLRGLELRYGRHKAKLKRGQLAYHEAVRFVREVGEGRAMIAAHRALETKKGKVNWL
jgi:hypothetical protein